MDSLKLLIVEDDADQRQLIRETLEDHFGRDTVVSADGIRAALARDLTRFDLILTDYNLPDGTGMQLLEQVRSRCRTPVIMVTGENVGHIAAEAIRKGATDYVVKVGDYLFTIAAGGRKEPDRRQGDARERARCAANWNKPLRKCATRTRSLRLRWRWWKSWRRPTR